MRRRLRAAADAFGVLVFASVFVAINYQVFMRYVVGQPISWGEEFPTLAFSVATLWAAALCLTAKDHIVFDLLYDAASPRLRRAMRALGGAVVAGVMAAALPAIVDFALYMKVLSTPILRIRLDFVFGFFALFIGALVVRAAWDIVRALRPAAEA
jgi:TRAP-type C4-dicarboxylate transport system permease small subunit